MFRPKWIKNGVQGTSMCWYSQMAHAGKRAKVPLATNDKEEACRTAARLYRAICSKGWDAGVAEILPGQSERNAVVLPTLGELIEKVTVSGAVANAVTLYNYIYGLRWIAEHAFNMRSPDSKYDYKGGGNIRWRNRVDRIRIGRLTPERVTAGITRHLQQFADNPLKLKRAQRSVRSYLRNASAMFQESLMKAIHMEGLENPFRKVKQAAERAPRYNSKVDAQDLLLKAREDLQKDPEAYRVILLALGAGLRRGEIDNLRWDQIDRKKNRIRVEVTEDFEGKSEDSHGFVFIDAGLMDELGTRGKVEDFLLEPDQPIIQRKHGGDYRAERTFKRVTAWLRSQGMTDQKPLHTLRKEFGSIVMESSDIHTASMQLRHADISTTARHYLDNRRHTTVQIGAMLKPKA